MSSGCKDKGRRTIGNYLVECEKECAKICISMISAAYRPPAPPFYIVGPPTLRLLTYVITRHTDSTKLRCAVLMCGESLPLIYPRPNVHSLGNLGEIPCKNSSRKISCGGVVIFWIFGYLVNKYRPEWANLCGRRVYDTAPVVRFPRGAFVRRGGC